MNSRQIVAGAIFCAVLGGGRFLGRSSQHSLAAGTGVDPVSPIAKEADGVASPTNTFRPTATAGERSPGVTTFESAPRPAAPQAANGVTDVDPHKAFGSKNAPIAMEIFSDFQCPACKQLFTSTTQKLMDNYVNAGKIYLIHRDFPLPMHAYSKVAARYSRAAAQLGKCEPVEQVLFQNQEKWEQSGDIDGTVASVLSTAEMIKVRALVKGGTLDAAIDKDTALGQGYHVNQTPTTIIHCKGQTYPVVGIVSFDVLKSFLDQLLAQK